MNEFLNAQKLESSQSSGKDDAGAFGGNPCPKAIRRVIMCFTIQVGVILRVKGDAFNNYAGIKDPDPGCPGKSRTYIHPTSKAVLQSVSCSVLEKSRHLCLCPVGSCMPALCSHCCPVGDGMIVPPFPGCASLYPEAWGP